MQIYQFEISCAWGIARENLNAPKFSEVGELIDHLSKGSVGERQITGEKGFFKTVNGRLEEQMGGVILCDPVCLGVVSPL